MVQLTRIDLATLADLGQGYLSDLEAGRRRGTRETLEKIAEKVNVDPIWIKRRTANKNEPRSNLHRSAAA